MYDETVLQQPSAAAYVEKAINCPKNEMVDEINYIIHDICLGELVLYLSSYSIIPHSSNGAETEALYPPESRHIKF